jgi:hypothetical protein
MNESLLLLEAAGVTWGDDTHKDEDETFLHRPTYSQEEVFGQSLLGGFEIIKSHPLSPILSLEPIEI